MVTAVTAPPRVEWARIEKELGRIWAPGEHFSVLGPSDSGKSTLTFRLANLRVAQRVDRGVVVFATKPRDSTLERWIKAHGAAVVESWRDVSYQDRKRRRIVVKPPYGRLSTTKARHAPVFRDALDGIMSDGSWSIVPDEVITLVEKLDLRKTLDGLWIDSRSNFCTVVAGAQRGTFINRSMVSQMKWLASFRFFDQDDATRVAEIGGDRRSWPIVTHLKAHEFLLRQTATGTEYRTHLTKKELTI